jgi:hypothetical protein
MKLKNGITESRNPFRDEVIPDIMKPKNNPCRSMSCEIFLLSIDGSVDGNFIIAII